MEVALNELTVDAGGVQVTVRTVDGIDIWCAARAAFEAATRCSEDYSSSLHTWSDDETSEAPTDDSRSTATKADQLRLIARGVLSDGRVHERREISKACREAGLDPQPLTKALEGHFERGTNMDGRPTYRDTSVPSPYLDPRTVPEEEKPEWLRNHAPAHEDGDLELIEASRNGAP
jgi:hypothetical protein